MYLIREQVFGREQCADAVIRAAGKGPESGKTLVAVVAELAGDTVGFIQQILKDGAGVGDLLGKPVKILWITGADCFASIAEKGSSASAPMTECGRLRNSRP